MFISILRRTCHRQIRRNILLSTFSIRSLSSSVWENKPKEQNTKFPTLANSITRDKEDYERLIPANDPDTFGSLSINVEETEGDEGDKQEEEYLSSSPLRSQQLGIRQYADMIKDCLSKHKLYEAMEVADVRMKEDGVKPTNYIYNILINGCAKVGYTQKAFSLYNKMKQRQLKVTGATYTSLFNACANSPFKKDALDRANHLREIMTEVGYLPNVSNYNAMIKAYGRLGDITTAFHLVDEMQTLKLPVRDETYSFLLQACASDNELGFRHAILVWQKMYRRLMPPNIFLFNLILRVTRDCGLGDVETTEKMIEELMVEAERRLQITENKKLKEQKLLNPESTETSENQLEESAVLTVVQGPPSRVKENNLSLKTPNLLAPIPRLGNLISIKKVTKPEDRFLLLGGFGGFIEEMDRHKVEPDIKTCTLLLEVLPSTIEAEKRLLTLMKERRIKCDVDFFNILIKKRAMRFDFASAQQVLKMIQTANLQPDIVTYGVLAIGCRTEKEARILLAQMQDAGISVNIEILGAMFRQGCVTKNYEYIEEILDIIRAYKVRPSVLFLKNLFYFRSELGHLTRKGIDSASDGKIEYTERKRIKKFRAKLYDWLDFWGIRGLSLQEAVKKYESHPYKQFKEPAGDGVEPEKNSLRRNYKKKKGKLAIIN